MYRFITYLFLLFSTPYLINAQTLQDDFEGGGNISSWLGDDCEINISFNNPYPQGINTSSKVLEYSDVGGQYANVRFQDDNNFNLSSNYLFTFKIYLPSNGMTGNQPNQVSLKLQNGQLPEPWSTQTEIIKPLVLDQWQTVTFDFENDPYINLDGGSPAPRQRFDLNRVVIQINGENNGDKVLAYLDDFYYFSDVPEDPVYDRLVWSDEFDKNGAIDDTKWFHQTQLPQGGSWFNGEIQHYTNRLGNSYVENGFLNIVAKKETFTDQGFTKQYTSARLNSKFTFQYGRIEVRAKLPVGGGTWPAIWMLGKNIREDGGYWDNQGYGTTSWPDCGEIDIMEHWGYNQNYVQSATHTPSSFGGTINHGGQYIETASNDFHVYTLEWSPQKLVFSVDEVIHFIYNPIDKNDSTWPFDAEQYILLNIAIEPSIVSNFSQSAMEIDYVRVYQESEITSTKDEKPKYDIYYPNPVNDELTIRLNDVTDQRVALGIYAIDGALIKSYQTSVQNNTLNLNNLGNLSPGVYFISFSLDSEHQILKFVKN
jgi:beta-glucanase (GH16 family)